MKYTLVAGGEATLPACLVQRAKNADEFRKSYSTVGHVTNTIKEELLARLNSKLFPKDSMFELPGWEVRQAKNIGYIKALKEVMELLP